MRKKFKIGFLKKLGIFVMAAVLLTDCLSLNMTPMNKVYAAVAHTQDEAIRWVKEQEGRTDMDQDGVYGQQCVDLIRYYYIYLGATPVQGNGKDYATNALPDGWVRIKGAVPQKGDIAVYEGNSSNQNGHVAIVEAENILWHSRFGGSGVVKSTPYKYNRLTVPYWGVIRPDWGNSGGSSQPSGPVTNSSLFSNVRAEEVTSTSAKILTDYPGYRYGDIGFYLGVCPEWDTMAKVSEYKYSGGTGGYTNGNSYQLGVDYGSPYGYKWWSQLSPGTTYYYAFYCTKDGVEHISSIQSFTTADTTPPVVTNIRTADVDSDGYTVLCDVTDDVGVAKVAFPTWTDANGQDDLAQDWDTVWAVYQPSYGNTYSFRVRREDHKNEYGTYLTDIYAYDAAGNVNSYRGVTVSVPTPAPKPDSGVTMPSKPAESASQFVVQAGSTKAGGTVTVLVAIKNNPGIVALRNRVVYDTKALELIQVDDLSLLKGYIQPQGMQSPHPMSWSDALASSNNRSNGDIAKLTFRVKTGTAQGDYGVVVQPIESYTFDGKEVSFAAAGAYVKVTEKLPGDVDGDGKVNGWDGVMLKRYLAGWDVTISSAASDVDGNGKVNGWDGVLLDRYLAGWDVVLK